MKILWFRKCFFFWSRSLSRQILLARCIYEGWSIEMEKKKSYIPKYIQRGA